MWVLSPKCIQYDAQFFAAAYPNALHAQIRTRTLERYKSQKMKLPAAHTPVPTLNLQKVFGLGSSLLKIHLSRVDTPPSDLLSQARVPSPE
jgi:hypothetical protein